MSQQSPTSAANSVCGITELLEMILQHVDTSAFLRAHRSHRHFRQRIGNSSRLKHKYDEALFRKAAPRHTWLCSARVSGSSPEQVENTFLTHDNGHPIDIYQGAGNRAQVARLHPCLPHASPPRYRDGQRPSTCLGLDWELLKTLPVQRLDDSLTQPPCTSLYSVPKSRVHTDWVAINAPCKIEGVRLRDLLVIVQGWPDEIYGLDVELSNVVWEQDDVVRTAEWSA